ncbi:MAG: DUF3800 domain-containing protein [Oscillospiraceae bacterium]|nr:DUF3800 domain-containing protein [Oscillospiraceae bacterium]
MLAFIDISGDPYSMPEKSPWIATHIICIRKRSIYDITAALFRNKRDILANEYMEMKSTDFVNKSTLDHPFLDKAKFLQIIMEQCIDHADCRHASIVFSNTGKNKKSDDNRLPKNYIDALWRIEVIAREWHVDDIIVVIDNNARKTDRNLAFAFNNYIYRSSGGNQLKHILPVPIFADSETTAGLQLADISAGIMRNYHLHSLGGIQTPSSMFHKKLIEYHSIIKARSIDKRIGGYNVSGIFCAHNDYSV